MGRPGHILNAASSLLGIALIIITGLNVSRVARDVLADEMAWGAAICLALSVLLSYVALRDEPEHGRAETWADRIFLLGVLTLFSAIVILALQSR